MHRPGSLVVRDEAGREYELKRHRSDSNAPKAEYAVYRASKYPANEQSPDERHLVNARNYGHNSEFK